MAGLPGVADLDRMVALINARSEEPLRLRGLAQALGCVEEGLGKLFRQHAGMTVRAYLAQCRMMRAADSVGVGDKIEAVALQCGYRSKKNFYKQFRRHFGTTPGNYRKDVALARTRSPNQAGGVALSVLLVASPTDDREMYHEFLRTEGVAVSVADTAEDGLVRAPIADVIVTEVRLRGAFDGHELIRRLRRGERTVDKKIIVLTASVLDGDRDAAHGAGCDVFLAKPCLPQLLLTELRRFRTGASRDRTLSAMSRR